MHAISKTGWSYAEAYDLEPEEAAEVYAAGSMPEKPGALGD